jgi:hypothetical protein
MNEEQALRCKRYGDTNIDCVVQHSKYQRADLNEE